MSELINDLIDAWNTGDCLNRTSVIMIIASCVSVILNVVVLVARLVRREVR